MKPEPDEHDIFLSYAHKHDKNRARVLAEAFERQGWTVWWDHDMLPGNAYPKEIQKKVTSAPCVVVLWSRSSVNSDWVRDEAHVGLKRKVLVPVLIDKVDPPLGFGSHLAATLTEWSPPPSDSRSPSYPEFERLIKGIQAVLEPPTETTEKHGGTKRTGGRRQTPMGDPPPTPPTTDPTAVKVVAGLAGAGAALWAVHAFLVGVLGPDSPLARTLYPSVPFAAAGYWLGSRVGGFLYGLIFSRGAHPSS